MYVRQVKCLSQLKKEKKIQHYHVSFLLFYLSEDVIIFNIHRLLMSFESKEKKHGMIKYYSCIGSILTR